MYEKIVALLKEKGLSIADLSRATGISESIFSNMKTRNGKLSIVNAAKVAAVLEVALEELL